MYLLYCIDPKGLQSNMTSKYDKRAFTSAGVRSNDKRESLSLLWAQTHDRPFPSHAAEPATTSAGQNNIMNLDQNHIKVCTAVCSNQLVTSGT